MQTNNYDNKHEPFIGTKTNPGRGMETKANTSGSDGNRHKLISICRDSIKN